MLTGVAWRTLKVSPEGPGALVPLRLLRDEWNSLKEMLRVVMFFNSALCAVVALHLKLSKYEAACCW